MLIEEYFIDFFFGLRSAFKGRFRSILAMIRDQSYLNMIVIESKTQGDHKELNIFLQKCLISSRFNQKLGLQRKNINLFHHKNRGPSDSLKDDLTAEIA